jgi:hypothetical protein
VHPRIIKLHPLSLKLENHEIKWFWHMEMVNVTITRIGFCGRKSWSVHIVFKMFGFWTCGLLKCTPGVFNNRRFHCLTEGLIVKTCIKWGELILFKYDTNLRWFKSSMSFTSFTFLSFTSFMSFTSPLRCCGAFPQCFLFLINDVPGNCRHVFNVCWYALS